MENLENKPLDTIERTERVQSIIERIPTQFGIFVTAIVVFVFALLLIFGWIIRYPDVASGAIVINSNMSPVKLVAEASGKLKLSVNPSLQEVRKGDVIAYIENPTSPLMVAHIDSLLKLYNPTSDNIVKLISKIPEIFSVGELNDQYFMFINSLEQLINYRDGKLLDKQYIALKETLKEQKQAISVAEDRVRMTSNSLLYAAKIYSRDSLLFLKQVISESELDRSKVAYNNTYENNQSNLNNLINARQQLVLTENKIQEVEVQNPERRQELMSNILSSYNKFLDDIKIWDKKYVFRAPFDGKLQFLKFWNNDQFIQAGEEVFTIIPNHNQVIGEVMLPNRGAGKITIGQEVIIKLDDFPYVEYGAVKGLVQSISLTTNTVRTDQGEVNNYLVIVHFPEQLTTNYGSTLNLKSEAKGVAEIIANDRRLIERLFDNLKYRITR